MQVRLRLIDGRTVQLGIAEGAFTAPGGEHGEVLDCTDSIALPGLVDAHAHLQANGVAEMVAAGDEPDPAEMRRNARAQLEAGVLVVADKGSKSDATLQFLDTAPHERPDLHMAGEIHVVEDGYYPGFGRVIDPDEAGDAAAGAAATRATWVKFIGDWPRRGVGPVANFDRGQLAAAVDAAHRSGARVAVHTMAPGAATVAVRAGVDSIEHGLFLTSSDVTELGRRSGAWVPTIVAMERAMESLRPGSSGRRLIGDGLDNVRGLLPEAVAAGVSVQAGTDLALRHGEVATELRRLGDYGLTPDQVVASAILGAAPYLGTRHAFTSGARADVVCVPGDPRDDLSVLTRPSLVMRCGTVIRSSR